MKKIFSVLLSAALATAALSSCDKAEPAVLPSSATEDDLTECAQWGTMHVTVGMPSTKAALSGLDEKAVHSLQVFVFNTSGKKETDKYVVGNSLDITSLTGEKHIWAVTNHSRIDDVGTEQALKEMTTDLADCYVYNSIYLVMAGNATKTIQQGNQNVQIDVTRLVSRVVLKQVKVNFADTYLKNSSFKIKEIYLKNVAGNTNFSLDKSGTEWDIMAPTLWYNKMKDEATAAVAPLICDRNLDISCAEGTATDIGHVLYCFPNPTATDNNSATWSDRKTRLVVHAEVGYNGTRQSYYTFTLPQLKRNGSYEITNITFTMLGKDNDNDDTVTDTGIASITLNVVDWDTATPLEYNM